MALRFFGRISSVVLALTIGLAACETAVSDDNGGDDPLAKSDWVAVSIIGKPVVNPGRVTMSFGEGRVAGRSGCNHYSGVVEYGKGAIKVGDLMSTKMACMENGVMSQEQAYLGALKAAERYGVGGDGKLTITTKGGVIVYDSAPRQVRPEG